MDVLKKNGVEKDTLIFFTSDNGHHKEGGNNPEFFNCNGPLRGMKRDLYEGGIRVPTVAWWPDTIPAGIQSDHPAQFADFMATACELAGVKTPNKPVDQFRSTFSARAPIRRSPSSSTGSFTSATTNKLSALANGKLFANPCSPKLLSSMTSMLTSESKNLLANF